MDMSRLNELGNQEVGGLSRIRTRLNIGHAHTFARIPQVDLGTLIGAVEQRVMDSRGVSRQAQLRGATNQFLVWLQTLPAETEIFDTAWKIVWYAEAKIADEIFSLASAEKFIRNVAQSLREMGYTYDKDILDTVRMAYLKSGARRPEHQAPPAVRNEVEAAGRLGTETEWLGLMIGWKTASRVGELQFLQRDHFREVSPRVWTVEFPYHKGDPFRLGTVAVMNLNGPSDATIHEVLNRRLSRMNCTAKVTELTTDRARTLLKLVRPDLSAHSIKRGALVALLRAGVPLSVI